jgi:hypothetical protein
MVIKVETSFEVRNGGHLGLAWQGRCYPWSHTPGLNFCQDSSIVARRLETTSRSKHKANASSRFSPRAGSATCGFSEIVRIRLLEHERRLEKGVVRHTTQLSNYVWKLPLRT